ncbi:MAG: hypothetical protein JW820_16125 [Spirochaetales bacterium]|nr:hypothetical protein [Spirochaetales bacterium]
MADERLTYRAAGVDVEANNEANERIKSHVRRTHTERVLTRAGLFGGALSLRGLEGELAGARLVGSLGYQPLQKAGASLSSSDAAGAAGAASAARAGALLRECRRKLPPSARPLAFLDYLAAEHLHPLQAEVLVGGFADALVASPVPGGLVPLIGGETAEMPSTFQRGAWEVVGALFALDPGGSAACGARLAPLAGLEHPALVFTMDGVGTKTRLGIQVGRTESLALDILHHSLDDILCQGAQGLGVLFYVGCHRVDASLVGPLLESARRACRDLGLVLLEAAVAEKPDLYLPGEYDVCASLAGFVDAGGLLQGATIRAGDLLVGLASSGLHTNGYSLARRALLERGGLRLGEHIRELSTTLGEALLEPHRNYAPAVLPLLGDPELGTAIRGVAHITGGGLPDNLVRILPPGLAAEVHLSSWTAPPLFRLIQRCGNIPDTDPEAKGMYESFNMGIGLVLVVEGARCDAIRSALQAAGETPVVIGRVEALPVAAAGSAAPRVRLVP